MEKKVIRNLNPRKIDFDGFPVRRFLPADGLRGVGPWVFFDHMGPFDFPPGRGIDVIPHPHIGLATVTYLFEGIITHRDTLGTVRDIGPGAVNLMTAGRGIAHSERTPAGLRTGGHRVHGLQLWHTLPDEFEESEPAFLHYGADEIPEVSLGGVRVRVLIGKAHGVSSPVRTLSPTLYLEAVMNSGAVWELPDDVPEMAVHPVAGKVRVQGRSAGGDDMVLLTSGARTVEAIAESRVAVIGGASPGDRCIWWNFVSSRKDRIEAAKADWKEGRFGPVTGDREVRAEVPAEDRHSRMPD